MANLSLSLPCREFPLAKKAVSLQVLRLSCLVLLFLSGCDDVNVPTAPAQTLAQEDLLKRSAVSDYAPEGIHKATIYTQFLSKLIEKNLLIPSSGLGTEIEVCSQRSFIYRSTISKDAKTVNFRGTLLTAVEPAFQENDGGILGSWIDRIRRTTRFTFLLESLG